MLTSQSADQSDELIYTERISSNKTEALFLALMIVSFLLFLWRVYINRLGILGVAFFCSFSLFLFYSLNYRTLTIQLTSRSLKLKFGLFTWTVPWDNIEECRIDEIPGLMRMGGAGIHFMMMGGRYRASFNFLEYPRVVIALRRKAGPVRDISFSTRQPEEVIRLIQDRVAGIRTAQGGNPGEPRSASLQAGG